MLLSRRSRRSHFFVVCMIVCDRCDKMDTVDKVDLTMFVVADKQNMFAAAVNNIDRSRKRRNDHETIGSYGHYNQSTPNHF